MKPAAARSVVRGAAGDGSAASSTASGSAGAWRGGGAAWRRDPSRRGGGVLADGWIGRGTGRAGGAGRVSITGGDGAGGGATNSGLGSGATGSGGGSKATGGGSGGIDGGATKIGAGGAASGRSSDSNATVAPKSGPGTAGSSTSSADAIRSVGDGPSSMKAPGSATTSAATSTSSWTSRGRLASTTRSSSCSCAGRSGGADGRIAIVSSKPVASSRTGSAATRGTDGEDVPGPTAHRAIVSTSGVGVADAPGSARTVSGGGASTARRGRMHCSITTSSSPGGPSQRMSPLRRTVPPGSSGLSLTCSVRAAPVSWAVTRPASTTMRAWYGLTVSRSRRRPEPGAEPSVRVPLSGSRHRVPASGPPSTVKEADFVSAITPSRPRLEGRRRAARTPPF